MHLGLEGKVAAVTGAAAGIGAAAAAALAAEGCDLALIDLQPANASAEAVRSAGRRALVIETDVRDHAAAAAALERALEELGGLDALVCSAGITRDAAIAKMSERQWDEVIDVNLKGVFNFNRAAAPIFQRRRHGTIVNIASINGLRGKHGQANYAASKGGVIAFSKTLARELGRFNVTVNVVAPGMVLTEMVRALPPDVIQRAIDETATGHLATPEACGALVAFLCSTQAEHITGEVIQIDGGQYM
jgi:3-oxoacyl-[acyl-carrier protein] reductase